MTCGSIVLVGFLGQVVYSMLGIIQKGGGPASCDDLCWNSMLQVDLLLIRGSRQEERASFVHHVRHRNTNMSVSSETNGRTTG